MIQTPRKCRQIRVDKICGVFSGMLSFSNFFIGGHGLMGTGLSHSKTNVSALKKIHLEGGCFCRSATLIFESGKIRAESLKSYKKPPVLRGTGGGFQRGTGVLWVEYILL